MALKYISEAELASRELTVVESEDTNVKYVYFNDILVSTLTNNNGKLTCSCNQVTDVGTPCCHLYAVGLTTPHSYIHDMWLQSAYLSAFDVEVPVAEKILNSAIVRHRHNIETVVEAVRSCTNLNDQVTEEILKLLKPYRQPTEPDTNLNQSNDSDN